MLRADPGQLAALFAMLEVGAGSLSMFANAQPWGVCTKTLQKQPAACTQPPTPLHPPVCNWQGVVQHDFLGLRRRLEADFAFFSACAAGASPSTHLPGGSTQPAGGGGGGSGPSRRRAFKRLSSIEAHERRFLEDFMQCMKASHFRLMGTAEWEAAAAEVLGCGDVRRRAYPSLACSLPSWLLCMRMAPAFPHCPHPCPAPSACRPSCSRCRLQWTGRLWTAAC